MTYQQAYDALAIGNLPSQLKEKLGAGEISVD